MAYGADCCLYRNNCFSLFPWFVLVEAYMTVAYLFLNWGPNILSPKVPPKGDHKDEKWFFINGIAVGNYWRQGAIDKLTDLFGRPVYGIENKTYYPEVTF